MSFSLLTRHLDPEGSKTILLSSSCHHRQIYDSQGDIQDEFLCDYNFDPHSCVLAVSYFSKKRHSGTDTNTSCYPTCTPRPQTACNSYSNRHTFCTILTKIESVLWIITLSQAQLLICKEKMVCSCIRDCVWRKGGHYYEISLKFHRSFQSCFQSCHSEVSTPTYLKFSQNWRKESNIKYVKSVSLVMLLF